MKILKHLGICLFIFCTNTAFAAIAEKIDTVGECQKIVMRNGDTILAKVTLIAFDKIQYRSCDYPNDPEFVLDREEVYTIIASDGRLLLPTYSKNEFKPLMWSLFLVAIGTLAVFNPFFGWAGIIGLFSLLLRYIKWGKQRNKHKYAKWVFVAFILALVLLILTIAFI